MSEAMTFSEFSELMKHIIEFHTFNSKEPHGRRIKYVRPSFDLRTNDVFLVSFNSYGNEKELHVVNDCRNLDSSLYERCMKWLDGENVK
jgi:hypothetical protein